MKSELIGLTTVGIICGLAGMIIGIVSERTESEFITKHDKVTVIKEDKVYFNQAGHYCRYYLGDSGKYVVSDCNKYRVGEGVLK